MSERAPLFQDNTHYEPLEGTPRNTFRSLGTTGFFSIIFGAIGYVVGYMLNYIGVRSIQFIYETLFLGVATVFFLLSALAIGFGSSPSLAGAWAKITGSPRKITPAETTFIRGLRYLLSGIIFIFFATLTL